MRNILVPFRKLMVLWKATETYLEKQHREIEPYNTDKNPTIF